MNEFENEPIPGLPERLPPGERILWQGAPRWQTLARRAFHLRKVAVYFGVLMLWRAISGWYDGESIATAAAAALWLAPVAMCAAGLLILLSWMSARATMYTITDRRVVMRFGVALPMSVNIPLRVIDGASLKLYAGGTGDIPLSLQRNVRVGYVNLWPHVRPWQFTRPQPMLRAVTEASMVAQTLSRALSASAGVTAQQPEFAADQRMPATSTASPWPPRFADETAGAS